MPADEETRALTELLLKASAQHLRLTLETLPTGLIEVTESGLIASTDEWTKEKLGGDMRGSSITELFDENSLDLQERLRTKNYGRIGKVSLRTGGGKSTLAELVLAPAIQMHNFFLSIIFTTDCI